MTLASTPEPLPTVYSKVQHHVFRTSVLGQQCNVHASVSEIANTETGDQTISVSIDEIIALNGQTIAPRLIPLESFRDLCAHTRLHHNVVTQ